MKIIAINTASAGLNIYVKNSQHSFEMNKAYGFKHSENLFPMLEYALHESQLNIDEIDLLVCAKGPGSFTGLRIGISSLKGISTATSIPLVSIPTLDAMAYPYNYFDGAVIPVLDAKKNRIYTAIYKNGTRISDFLDISLTDLASQLVPYQRILLTGTDAPLFFDKLSSLSGAKLVMSPVFDRNIAYSLCVLGKNHYLSNGADKKDEGALYLRKSDAELSLKTKDQ